MRFLFLAIAILSCGGSDELVPTAPAQADPNQGTIGWACEHPRCCARRAKDNECVDYGCCDDGPVIVP